MALVGGNTTATGYGQAYVPMAPPPPPPPIPTYGGLVDDSTAYNASVLGTVPPVAGGGPVISVPDAPLYRDPNNPNVVWNEEYQRWYDTASGLWRNPDTGTWENWAGTQTWNPNTGKQIPTATANIVNQASLQPTAEGMAAAKAIIQGGGGAKTIVATPDRPKTLADWAAEFPDAPGVKLAEDVAGMWQGPGIPERTGPLSLAGLESYPASEIERLVNLGNPQDGPGFTSSSGVQYPVEYLRDSQGRPLYEQNIMGEWVPVQKATLSGLDILRETASAQTASPYQLEEFDPIRNRLPGFVNESIEFATSPVGAASNILFPFTGASSVGANIGLNIAQDLAFGAAKVGAEKAGVPEPLAYALGFAAAVGSEAAMGRALGKIAGNAADMPAVLPRRTPDVPKIDMFTGRDVRLTLSDGSAIPAVDMGAGALPGYRAIQLPDGQIVDAQTDVLEHLAPRKPLTIGDQIDDVLNPNAVTDPRAAMRYPAEEITAPDFRRGSVENDVTVKRSKGTSTLTDQVTGEEVGRVVNEPGTGYRATLADGTDVGTYKSTVTAENAIKGAYVARKGTETPLEGAVDLARGTRAVKVAGRPINPNIADSMAAAVIDPSPATVERASQMAMSEVTNVDFVGVNLADIAYVLGKDAEGNPINVSKLVEYRKIDEMARNGVINPRKDPLYRVPKDLLNEEYKIQTGGQWIQNAKGEWKVAGGRRPTWLVPKGSRPLVYDTRELHQAAMREAGYDNEMIRAILPEGPGLRTADGGYLHGSLLSYMNARDWRKTLDLEKAALQAPDSNTLIRLKLEQAKIAGVDFNPFDPRTKYGLFKFIDDPQVKKAADAAVRNTPLDMATEGTAAHNRAIRSALGQAEPVEMAAHEAEVRAVAREVAQDIPKANIPDSPQMLGLMENAAPATVKAKANRVGGVAREVVATPFLGLRNLLLAGDSIIGRQLWGSAVLWPRDTSAAIVRTLRNLRNQDALWRQVDEAIEQRPHMARVLVQKGTPGSLEETVTVGKWMHSGKWNPLARIEEVNALMKNMVRLNLDNKITALRRGIPTTPEQLAAQAEYIGVITGRGSGEFLDKHAAKLNAGLFISSRYTASRFQFWGLLVPFHNGYTGIGLADGMLWKQNAARMVAASSVAATTYLLLGQVPGVTIETDPRASKFGKFNWRGKWYDFTGAYTDPIRLFAQMSTETGISESGSKYKFDRGYGPLSNVPGLGAAFSYMEARMPPQARILAEGAGWMQPFEERQNIPGLPAWTTKYTPLSLNAMFDMWKQTNDLGDGFWNVVDSAALLAGFGVNPEGNRMAWEKQVLGDAKTRAALDDPDFWKPGSKRQSVDDLTKTGLAYISAHPEIFGEKPGAQMAEFKRNAEIVAAARAAVRGDQLSDDWKFENGDLSPDDYRIRESVRARTLSRSISGVYGPYEETESTDVVDLYFDAIDRATYTVGEDSEGNPVTEVDWEAVDLFRSKLSKAERAQLERYFEISSSKGTPVQQRMDADRKLIEDSGFWDLKRTYYAEFVKDHPELPDNYDDFRDQVFRDTYEKVLAETGSAGVAYNDASKAVSARERELGFTDGYKNTMLYPWVMENQDAAKAAAYWKYYTPDNAAEKAIFGQDPSEIASATEVATVKAQVITPAYNAVIADAWHTWASQNVSVTLSDGRTAADFPTHDKFNEALRDEALAAKEKELGRKLTQTEENEVKASVADVTDNYTSGTKKAGGVAVRYVNSSGTSTTGYLSQATVSRLNAIAATYKENPELAQQAYNLGIIDDPGVMGRAYLAALGVVFQ